MSKDEYGYDPNETTYLADNPFWDSTDSAHPAWWRGEEYASKMISIQISKIVLNEEIEDYRELRKKLKDKFIGRNVKRY